MLHTSTIISARGSKWPFLGTKATGSSARKKEEIFRARSFLGCSNVRGRFLSPGTVVAASYSARWRSVYAAPPSTVDARALLCAMFFAHVFVAVVVVQRTDGRTNGQTYEQNEWLCFALGPSRKRPAAALSSTATIAYLLLLVHRLEFASKRK